MYNQIFSDVWKMDRCIEASWVLSLLINPIVLFFILTAIFFFYFSSIKRPTVVFAFFKSKLLKKFNFLALLISIFAGFILFIPAMIVVRFIAIIISFGVFNCNFGPLWKQVDPAHEIHATLKEMRTNGVSTPRNLNEFTAINPEAYQKLKTIGAELTYEYHADHNGYHFSLRPSKYLIADFSDEDDYVLYRTESIVSPHLFEGIPLLREK